MGISGVYIVYGFMLSNPTKEDIFELGTLFKSNSEESNDSDSADDSEETEESFPFELAEYYHDKIIYQKGEVCFRYWCSSISSDYGYNLEFGVVLWVHEHNSGKEFDCAQLIKFPKKSYRTEFRNWCKSKGLKYDISYYSTGFCG